MDKLEPINTMLDDICKAYTELKEKHFIQVCDENDFIVGTPIIKEQLKELLPDNANIYVDMHIEPDKIYMIKKCVLHPDYQKAWIDL